MESIREKTRAEAKRVEEDTLFSAKRHFITASFWSKLHFWIGVPTAVLAALAGVSALSQFDNHNIVAGVIAIIVAALTALTTFLDPNGKANTHHNAGNLYNALRNRARIFYEIDSCVDCSDRELIDQLKELTNQRDELNQNSPITPKWVFGTARASIEGGEAAYQIDKVKKSKRPGRN